MTEMRREAKPKGILSDEAEGHITTRKVERASQIDPTGSERQPDPATREEHLGSHGRPKPTRANGRASGSRSAR
jgi:hypothetical protein